jgi:hypothetical protein
VSLLALQQQLAQDVAKLIQKAEELGFGVTLGEAWRTPQQAEWDAEHGTGIKESVHCQRLAIDLNLFKDGEYLTDDSTGAYTQLGEWWETLGPDHFWGGRFKMVDLDHFSISPDGVHK